MKRERGKLVEERHAELSVRKQSELLEVTRSVVRYEKAEESGENQKILRLMDEIYLERSVHWNKAAGDGFEARSRAGGQP